MDYYKEIKNELLNNEINRTVKTYSINKNDLTTYYNVGKMLSEASKKYKGGIIKTYAEKLKIELDKKYDYSYLNKMKKFYILILKMATVSPLLSYNHYVELLPINDLNKVKYYIMITENEHLSVRKLRERIKTKEYERLPIETREKLINKNSDNSITDYIKDPIIIRNKNNHEEVSERVLQRMILDDIPSFLDELGEGFTFIKNEYKIKIGNNYNYIDLLLFNITYNRYVVVELKVTELKKEHIGQIEVYMNYIDKFLKTINQNKTVGIIIVRKNNKNVIEYVSDKRILSNEYILM